MIARLLAGLVFAIVLSLLARFPRTGVRASDAAVALVVGLTAGSRTPVAVGIALAALSVTGGLVVLARREGARTLALPLAPFLAVGGLVALLT